MAGWLNRILLGGPRAARGIDSAEAVRYLDDLMKAQRYDDQVKYLDEFYDRTPQAPAPAVEIATRAPTTAEQFMAAGIPMPSAARRLVDAADEAASAGLGPENAVLREWIDSQPALPTAVPRGSQRTALESIGDSWDMQVRNRNQPPSGISLRGAMGRAADSVRPAIDAASGMGRMAASAAGEMGPLALAAAGTGTVAAIAATRAVREQRARIAEEELARRQQMEVEDAAAAARQQEVMRAMDSQDAQDEMLDSVPMDLGFMDEAINPQARAVLRAAAAFRRMIPSPDFHNIINTLDDPQEQVRLSFDAFSDSDLVDEFKPRPRLATPAAGVSGPVLPQRRATPAAPARTAPPPLLPQRNGAW
jgi:hypothetical protein